jgi:hypothetical protein
VDGNRSLRKNINAVVAFLHQSIDAKLNAKPHASLIYN